MMRLIDADALYETLKTDEEIAMERVSDTPLCFSDGTLNASFLSFLTQASDITNFKNMVYDAPTVDAVEVIRCKDCKNSEHWYRDRRRCYLWSENGVSVFDSGFCNYAERRQE